MKKYYECPTQDHECPYWDWKHHKCAMGVIDGVGPAGECDEYDFYNGDEEEEDEE